MINALAIIGCILSMACSLACAYRRMKAVYTLGIVNGCLFVALNASIAVASPDQSGVALMIIPSAWLAGTSAFGLWRLK